MPKLINTEDIYDTCLWDIVLNWNLKKEKGINVTIDELTNSIIDYLENEVESIFIDDEEYKNIDKLYSSKI